MTRIDRTIALIVFVLAVLGFGLWFLLFSDGKPEVVVQAGEKEVFRAPLGPGEKTITVTGPVGKSIIEIRDGRAHMLWSDCPDKICMNMGWISRPGQVVVCMPNKVVISIEEAR